MTGHASRSAVSLALCTLTLAACRGPVSEAPRLADAALNTIDVVAVVEQPLDVTVAMPGELNPFQAVALYSKVSGFVKSIGVDRGSRVRAGQLVAVIDAPELASARAEAQSRLQAAQAQLVAIQSRADASASTLERLRAAAATPGVVAGNDLVVAEKALQAEQGQVAAAQQNIEAARQAVTGVSEMEAYLRLTAPFDGIVTERNVHPGALVGPSGAQGATPIVRIVDTRRLRLVVPVPEAYTAGVMVGTTIPFSVAAYPGEQFSGVIARIAPSVDVPTRTMAVELDVANGDGRLAPGAFCQVRWPIRRPRPSLLVPNGAVANTTDRTFVVRVTNGRTEWVDVKTGVNVGPLVEVFGELHPGDEIAVRGTDELRPGSEVHVKAKTSPRSS
jgi:membrane fusion protein, multidrug efflux system